MEMLYHGSKIGNLTTLNPCDPKRGEALVYATSEPVFAVLLLHRPGAGLVRMWGRDKLTNKMYLVERKEGFLRTSYQGQSGYIYSLPTDGFQRSPSPKDEWINKNSVAVLGVEYVPDLWEYLEKAAEREELNLYYYANRLNHPEGSDERIVETALNRIKKYGEAKIIPEIQKYQPHILETVLSRRKDKALLS